MKNWVIYRITNLVNGKIYIGKTIQGLARRRSEHIHRFNLGERNHKLYLAMRKHGLENFKFEVLCCALKIEYLDQLEIQFIKEYNSFNRGYNMTCGGEAIAEETRRKIGLAHKGRKVTWAQKGWITRRNNPDAKHPKDYVAKGANNTNSKSYLVRFPCGKEDRISGLNQFCKANSLTKKCLLATLGGDQYHHKGFSLLARFTD